MAKFTQDGCTVEFILTLRTILDPCNIRFDLIRDIDNNIIIPDSVIAISTNDSILFDKSPVVTYDSSILLQSDELVIVLPGKIEPPDSVICIKSDDSKIESFFAYPINTKNSIIKVSSAYSRIKNPAASDLPTGISTSSPGGDGISKSWGVCSSQPDIIYTIPWDTPTDTVLRQQIRYDESTRTDSSIVIPWQDIPTIREIRYIRWGDFEKTYNTYTSIPWDIFETQDPNDPEAKHSWNINYQFIWGSTKFTDAFISIPWNNPGAKDPIVIIPWNEMKTTDYIFEVKWLYPDYVNVIYDIVWGPVDWSDICCKKYYPPPACSPLMFNMTEPAIKDVCQGIVLSIGPMYDKSLSKYCPYQHIHSGGRDPFDYLRDIEEYIIRPRDEYDMINTVTVQVLPLNSDLPPVEVSTISINTDKNSYLWSFSMAIGKDDFSQSFLDMVKPRVVEDDIVYTDILININQNFWVCRVEGYSESRTFGKDTWQVTGRSPSMELGSPQNKKFTYTYNNPNNDKTSGAQIIEEMLQGVRIGNDNSGWVPVFDRYGDKVHTGFNPSGADDWGFRNNSLSWQDVTQIEAVTALTESIGAFIITEPNSIGAGLPPEEQQQNHKKLYIRPKYNYPPWHWNASSIHWQDIWGKDSQGKQIPGNKLISTELAMDVGRSNENKADYNAVMVMGTLENQGDGTGTGFPVVELYRKGVGQGFRVYAPDIVDEKLQSAPACIEAGRPTLCETGFWLKHTLKMYSIRYPSSTDETLPPLCWPGDFVQVQEHNRVGKREKIWYGDVEAVQVDVAVNNNAVYVTQTLGINEYVG